MRIIDAQIHEPAPWANWAGESTALQHSLMTDLTLGYLDAVGIHGVVISPTDIPWAAAAAAAFPDRFSYAPNISPTLADVDGDIRMAKSRHGEGLVGLRVTIGWPLDGTEVRRLEAGGWDPVFAACEKYKVPVFLFITGWLPKAADIATRFPGLTLIIDHLGLRQPPLDVAEDPPFKRLPELLDLAKFPNVAVKLCGLPALSREWYPYNDVVPHLRAIVDAFGADRLMWASDTSRFSGRIGLRRSENPRALGPYQGKHTYAEALHFIRDNAALTTAEKEAMLGGTVRRLLGWPNGT
ncbi:MAG: amidohydrolase [Rhodospirillaceae bacterium]|nr:MAG: amidohydrolase [Rhodospirillaceae bacterium]